ncbi:MULTISPECIES: hypothetical protein [Bacillus cereus group]|uniref:hypothetical protein n=1 Tax=Bacillus cereus group TaxID=86661 RepID=UPI000BEC98F9|nr:MULTISPECIES: hypothetical protein [Bacillus cereus group]PEG10457.1 hypothetical protein CON96_10305 [Bacillus wiedmannii]PGT87519.1 hypothetical protein COD17_15700 [Bacillus thuringiensis]
MFTRISVNDVEMRVQEYIEVKNEDNLEEISFGFTVIGNRDYQLFINLFKGEVNFINLQTDEQLLAQVKSSSSRYEGELTDTVPIEMRYTLTPIDSKEEVATPLTKVAQHTIYGWARTRSLVELLESKGIITKEEFTMKFEEVLERDGKEMIHKLLDLSEQDL